MEDASGIRMKGGVRSVSGGFVAIMHKWDNVECRGEPEEWRCPQVFLTEEAAMQYYKTSIRPLLEQMMTEVMDGQPGITCTHQKLEE